MAASNNPTPAKPKKEFTPEQKKQFTLLGVIGVLAIGAVAANWGSIAGGGSSGATTAETVAATPSAAAGATPGANPDGATGGSEGIAPGTGGGAPTDGAASGGAASGGAATGTVVAYAGVNRSRTDPFTPFVILPPLPTPAPPVPTPVPPVPLPSANELERIVVPGVDRSASGAQGPTLILPSVVIPRMNIEVKAPRDAFPPARTGGAGSQSTDPEPSFDKRLSGVVIAGGVRALLEINGLERKSYVVQPGDTVEGITVLDIQRFDEGGRTITRMLIRENGQIRYVDLKAAPQPAGGAEGPGGQP